MKEDIIEFDTIGQFTLQDVATAYYRQADLLNAKQILPRLNIKHSGYCQLRRAHIALENDNKELQMKLDNKVKATNEIIKR